MLLTSKRSSAPHCGGVERRAGARQAVALQAAEIDAPFEIDIGVAGRRNGAVPVPMGRESIGRCRPGRHRPRIKPHFVHRLSPPPQLLLAALLIHAIDCICDDCACKRLHIVIAQKRGSQ